MPTVPSIKFSFKADAADSARDSISKPIAVATSDNGSDGYATGGPTPDPELDDVVLVSVVTGDAVGCTGKENDSPPTCPRRLPSLSNLVLHSPSSIIGTPLDSTSRFEYPFPVSGSDSALDMDIHYSPSMFHTLSSYPSFSPTSTPSPPRYHGTPAVPLVTPSLSTPVFASVQPLLSSPSWNSLTWNSLPTRVKTQHPKLSPPAKEPPVPPRLARKRMTLDMPLGLGISSSSESLGNLETEGGMRSRPMVGDEACQGSENSGSSSPSELSDEKKRRNTFPA